VNKPELAPLGPAYIHHRHTRVQSIAGFTLVEMLLVLAILVSLTAVSLPSIMRWQRGLPLDQAVSLLQIQLQETRLAAVRSGETWVLELPTKAAAGYRRSANATSSDQPQLLNAAFQWPKGVRCEDNTAGSRRQQLDPVICRPDGTVSERTLRLIDTHGAVVIIHLDRLTGTARVQPIALSARCAFRRAGDVSPQITPRPFHQGINIPRSPVLPERGAAA
jgi:prepilin-type N-terminal cleavage/methylation domain-containing protein